ncbi:hypothetical protein ACFPK9_11515 [Rubritalea spongiae]|uniref:Uncharacterized protein n=1 Tax=Rubritalea spongiae TaxID=430797 RepID=A0ABW5DY88_9BACT
MSLKGFHIVFITVVTLFFALVAGWAFTGGVSQDASFWKNVGWVCAVVALITPVYGVYFIKKAKKLYS